MNEQDRDAFEKWFKDHYARSVQPTNLSDEGKRKAWSAALEYEREKTKKMIESLIELNDHIFESQISFYVFHKINNIIRKYKGEI